MFQSDFAFRGISGMVNGLIKPQAQIDWQCKNRQVAKMLGLAAGSSALPKSYIGSQFCIISGRAEQNDCTDYSLVTILFFLSTIFTLFSTPPQP